jgi:protein-S-isoprenylcysteine O-methyltransferase Ste14
MEGEPTGGEKKRHPSYFGFFLAYFGTGIACASWIFLLCAFVWIVSWQFGIVEEERILLEKYGEAYQQYMKRTPRWIGLPKKGEVLRHTDLVE